MSCVTSNSINPPLQNWVKCASCADRLTADLAQHASNSGCKLTAEQQLDAPRTVHHFEVVPDKAAIRRTFKKNTKPICDQLASLTADQVLRMRHALDAGSASVTVGEFTLDRAMVTVVSAPKTVHVAEIVPNVVHVSFGIDRLMQAVNEANE